MLENETYEKAYKKFRKLERNQQAILLSLFGVLSIGISIILAQYVPKAEPISMSSMEEYLYTASLVLFVGGIFLLLIGTTIFSLKTQCKFCKMKT
jgi:hypothetical protein